MFEKELFICIKMDLALNNQQRLIYHKTQANKESTFFCKILDIFVFVDVCWRVFIQNYVICIISLIYQPFKNFDKIF